MCRLTQKDGQGNWCVIGLEWEQLHVGQVITQNVWEKLYGALWKLVEYEETGLTPEEVGDLQNFEMSNAKKYLCELEKRRWIPVAEQLPVDDTDVIVCKSDGIINIAFWSGDAWMSLDSNYTLNVFAWMPLPEPYNPQN